MKKQNKLFIIVILIVIILLGLGVRKALQVKKNEKVDLGEITKYSGMSIESTKEHPIEKDGIEVKKIEFVSEGQNQLKVKAEMKNNTGEELDGYLIVISLLDKEENVISSISNNSEDKIENNEKFEFEAGIDIVDFEVEIASAKIDYLDKNTNKAANEEMILPSDENNSDIPEPTVEEEQVNTEQEEQ